MRLCTARFLTPWVAAMLLLSVLSARAEEGASERVDRFERSLRPAISIEGQPEQRWTLQERMAHWKVPGLSVAVIRDGKLAWAKGYGVLQAGGGDAVDTQTMFSVGPPRTGARGPSAR